VHAPRKASIQIAQINYLQEQQRMRKQTNIMTTRYLWGEFMDLVFKHAKFRNLIGWVFLAFFISLIISVFTNVTENMNDLSTRVHLIIVFYIVPIFWFVKKLKKADCALRMLFIKPVSLKKRTMVASVIMPVFFALGMILFVISFFVFVIPEALDMALPEQKISLSFANLTLKAMTLVIIAPICEEILFRGYLLGRLSYKFGVRKGIIFSSIIFGVLHITNMFGAAMFGVILCVLYLKSNSLITSIIVHASYNSIVALATLSNSIDSSTNDVPFSIPPLWMLFVLATLFTLVGLVWIVPFLKKNWPPANAQGNRFIEL
jgi:membrane protease YdiL (CAAX protease family)